MHGACACQTTHLQHDECVSISIPDVNHVDGALGCRPDYGAAATSDCVKHQDHLRTGFPLKL